MKSQPNKQIEQSLQRLNLAKLNRQPVLGEYTDFRIYLNDFYQYKRRETLNSIRPYTYAHFSAAADIKSPNYLRLIIDGQRNLSKEMIKKFSKALGHSAEEAKEFAALVLYGQAQSPLERNHHLRSLAEIRIEQQIKAGAINPEIFEKVPSWVSWVLFALLDQEGVEFKEESLRYLLRNKASLNEIKTALDKLIEAGVIEINDVGEVRKLRQSLPGMEEIPVELVRKIQAELIYLSLESLFQDRAQEREIGALTMALTEEEFEQFKFELRQLRKRWFRDHSVKRLSSKGERVFQLNMQLFPLTRKV